MYTYIICLVYIYKISICSSFNQSNSVHQDSFITRVVNGWPANYGDVPYQIAFKQSVRRPANRYATFCGGTIIAPTKLLSAAHCFTDKPNICAKMCGSSGYAKKKVLSLTYAVAGQLRNIVLYHHRDTKEEGQWRRLKQVRYPPKYNFPKLDIAIVFLHQPFIFNNYVNSVPFASKMVDYDGKCLVSGFGRISNKQNSDKLLLAHLTLLPMRLCNRMHRKNMRLFICTSSHYTDVGKGDSGGPLVCKNTGDPKEGASGVLVGVVSGHAHGIGSFFTRVSSYYNYIERNKSHSDNTKYVFCIVLLNPIQWIFLLF